MRRDPDPHEIAPDEFFERYGTDDPAEALRLAERQPSTTPESQQPRCPECGTINLKTKPGGHKAGMSHRVDTPYWCGKCGEHVEDPTEGADTEPETDGSRREKYHEEADEDATTEDTEPAAERPPLWRRAADAVREVVE